jgi:glutaredoxin-like YruB-family protein
MAAGTAKKQPTVIVFTTPTCSWCRVVKQHLKKHNIRFKEIDISKDERAARDMVRRTGQQGVPVTLIGNRPIVGFKKDEINRLLDINGH